MQRWSFDLCPGRRVLLPTLATLLVFLLGEHARAAGRPGIDFSAAGYGGGGVALPTVPAIRETHPSGGDDTATIQAALDDAAQHPQARSGFRGAVVLRPGTYRISGQLRLAASGVVLRGDHATLLATGHSRRTLIVAGGKAGRTLGAEQAVSSTFIPAGSTRLTVASGAAIAVGDRVIVRRPSTREWIAALGVNRFKGMYKDRRLDWVPGSRDLEWERSVVASDPAAPTLTLDAPITTALDPRFGGGSVQTVSNPARLRHIGIEGLTLISEFDSSRPHDEEHAWIGIQLDHVEDAWVRKVVARNFVSAAIWAGAGARRITVADCRSEDPVAENGGWRRFGFYIGGQQILIARCTADAAREAFAAGHAAAGPNVFLECSATTALADSGPIGSWASGLLFDNVRIDGAGLQLANLGDAYQGAGWTAAHSVLWNCEARTLRVENPPGAENHAENNAAVPSLYRAQLAARLGAAALAALEPSALPLDATPVPRIDAPAIRAEPSPSAQPVEPLTLVNGRFLAAGKPVFGLSQRSALWQGHLVPTRLTGTSITRWAPGFNGPGLTEDLPELAGRLAKSGRLYFEAFPDLWYDRRRDAHDLQARGDSAVWAPFLELPWARSGEGRATDGLSRYDLTRFNHFYWDRQREFAGAARAAGIVHVHLFYDTHNLLENAAHWADHPWRPVNCLQSTGLPEPPSLDGMRKNIIHVAEQFYDVAHPVRRDLHHRLIWHGLDALADQPNVLHTAASEFVGPLTFQQFFLDEVAAWNRARGKRARVILITSKAITDAILADPVRSALVDAIDQRYWHYFPDGRLFAPHSDGKLAFRQLRQRLPGRGANRDRLPPSSAAMLYRQVRDYRDRYPEKAVLARHADVGPIPILMAGGSGFSDGWMDDSAERLRRDTAFVTFVREHLGVRLLQMTPRDAAAYNAWCLASALGDALFYSEAGEAIELTHPLPSPSNAAVARWFNPQTGELHETEWPKDKLIPKPTAEAWLLWLQAAAGI